MGLFRLPNMFTIALAVCPPRNPHCDIASAPEPSAIALVVLGIALFLLYLAPRKK